jgi:hypothetical protein
MGSTALEQPLGATERTTRVPHDLAIEGVIDLAKELERNDSAAPRNSSQRCKRDRFQVSYWPTLANNCKTKSTYRKRCRYAKRPARSPKALSRGLYGSALGTASTPHIGYELLGAGILQQPSYFTAGMQISVQERGTAVDASRGADTWWVVRELEIGCRRAACVPAASGLAQTRLELVETKRGSRLARAFLLLSAALGTS